MERYQELLDKNANGDLAVEGRDELVSYGWSTITSCCARLTQRRSSAGAAIR